eukprot:TRINITY_DN366_c0_g1_i1.p1 TRINITY_DN366_c0_g1~~TRINITY_DN366_c0_g1_i1.p1  ORF type:complete len:1177 (+),score=508.00 TRINITY_DN366_c0_g1_i1:146-3676(+)
MSGHETSSGVQVDDLWLPRNWFLTSVWTIFGLFGGMFIYRGAKDALSRFMGADGSPRDSPTGLRRAESHAESAESDGDGKQEASDGLEERTRSSPPRSRKHRLPRKSSSVDSYVRTDAGLSLSSPPALPSKKGKEMRKSKSAIEHENQQLKQQINDQSRTLLLEKQSSEDEINTLRTTVAEQLQQAQTDLAATKDRLAAVEKKKEKLKKKVVAAKGRADEDQAALAAAQAGLEQERTAVQREQAAVGQARATLAADQQALGAERRALDERIARHDKEAIEQQRKLAEEQTALKADALRVAEERAAAAAERQRLTAEREELARTRRHLEAERAAVDAASATLEAERRRLADQRAVASAAQEAAARQQAEAASALAALERQQQAASSVDALRSELETARGELGASRSSLDHAESELRALRHRAEQLEADCERHGAESAGLRTVCVQLQAELRTARDALGSVGVQLAAALAAGAADTQRLQNANEELRQQLSAAHDQIAGLLAQLGTAERQLQTLQELQSLQDAGQQAARPATPDESGAGEIGADFDADALLAAGTPDATEATSTLPLSSEFDDERLVAEQEQSLDLLRSLSESLDVTLPDSHLVTSQDALAMTSAELLARELREAELLEGQLVGLSESYIPVPPSDFDDSRSGSDADAREHDADAGKTSSDDYSDSGSDADADSDSDTSSEFEPENNANGVHIKLDASPPKSDDDLAKWDALLNLSNNSDAGRSLPHSLDIPDEVSELIDPHINNNSLHVSALAGPSPAESFSEFNYSYSVPTFGRGKRNKKGFDLDSLRGMLSDGPEPDEPPPAYGSPGVSAKFEGGSIKGLTMENLSDALDAAKSGTETSARRTPAAKGRIPSFLDVFNKPGVEEARSRASPVARSRSAAWSPGSGVVRSFGVREDINKAGMRRAKKKTLQFTKNGTVQAEPQMEDMSVCEFPFEASPVQGLFCVFDGHAGKECAVAAQRLFPKVFGQHLARLGGRLPDDLSSLFVAVYAEVDKQLAAFEYEGCTGTSLFVWQAASGERYAQCANVGDSSAFVQLGADIYMASKDHKASDPSEKKRIRDSGIEMLDNQTRVGGLAVSRAFGDHFLKNERLGLISEPFVSDAYLIDDRLEATAIVASDGLWDVISGEDAMAYIDGDDDADAKARRLLQHALKDPKCVDNITVIVVEL